MTVNADPVLDRYRQRTGLDHCLDALGHQPRMGHQAGTNHVVLYPIAGATDIQIDLGKACLLGQCRAGCQFCRIAAAQLQGQRLLLGVVTQKA